MFKTKLESDEIKELQAQLLSDIIDPNYNSDDLSNCFYKIINAAVSSSFSKRGNVKGKSKFPINKWFNEECKNIKTQVSKYAKHYDISKPSFSEIYHRLECEYKRNTKTV